ncbi:hypothetical protein OG985_18115 [Streptomyces sp. NBC_00289]|uniref:hypothetical protein n=1 Tax=Streptomyces sp. NBC_00289 TaxID=2975703 RepID=UPI003252B750
MTVARAGAERVMPPTLAPATAVPASVAPATAVPASVAPAIVVPASVALAIVGKSRSNTSGSSRS